MRKTLHRLILRKKTIKKIKKISKMFKSKIIINNSKYFNNFKDFSLSTRDIMILFWPKD